MWPCHLIFPQRGGDPEAHPPEAWLTWSLMGARLPGTPTDLTPFATRPVDSLAVQFVLIGSRECVPESGWACSLDVLVRTWRLPGTGPCPEPQGLCGTSAGLSGWCVLPAFLQRASAVTVHLLPRAPAAPGPSRPTLFMPNPQQRAQSHSSAFQTPGMKGRPLRLAGEAWRGWGNDPVPTSAHGSVEAWKDVLKLMVSHLASPLRNRGAEALPREVGLPLFPLFPQVPTSFHLGHRWGCPEAKHL